MGFCHEISVLRRSAFQQLGQFVSEWRAQWVDGTPDFEHFEHELHKRIMAIERQLLEEELARYDVTAEQIEVGEVTYRHALTSSETYLVRIPAKTITYSGSWRSGNPGHGDQSEARRHWK